MVTRLQGIRQTLRSLQTLWSIAGLTLIAIALTEAGLRGLFAVKDALTARPDPDPRVIAAGYGGESWPIRHYRELEALADRWQPYVYFRQKPFSGATIHVDAEGLRRTWHPPSAPPAGAEARRFRVLMLGGSSLWGFGARDEHTIPSLIARRLDENGLRVEVRNLAEIGYVNTQEIMALVRELQSGYRPDVVVFYDGVNDTTAALLEGEAGVTTNERNRRGEFNILQSPARLGAAILARLIEDSACYRFAGMVGRRLFGQAATSAGLPPAGRRGELAAEVLRRYRANLVIANELGRGFGFETLAFWQPVIFHKRPLDPFEQEEAGRYGWLRDFFEQVHQAIRGAEGLKGVPGFHDLTGAFEDVAGLSFIDYCHTTESGNERLARAMAAPIEAALRRRPPPARDPGPRPASEEPGRRLRLDRPGGSISRAGPGEGS